MTSSAAMVRRGRRTARPAASASFAGPRTEASVTCKRASKQTLHFRLACARLTRVGHSCCHRPGRQGGARGHGAQSDQAKHEPGREIRQVALRRSVPLQPEAGLRKQLGQRVGGAGLSLSPHVTSVITISILDSSKTT